MNIGTIVRYNTGDTRKLHDSEGDHALGRVNGHEIYRDDNGTREWCYVNWFGDDGKPSGGDTKHSPRELVVVKEAPATVELTWHAGPEPKMPDSRRRENLIVNQSPRRPTKEEYEKAKAEDFAAYDKQFGSPKT